VRAAISRVSEARASHALVVGRKEELVGELNQSKNELAAVQAQLTAREKEIAKGNGALPNDALPEDAEISRLSRHIRIRQERVRQAEGMVRESQERIDSQIRAVEESWVQLGASISDRLLKQFRDAAAALTEAQFSYFSLFSHFCGKWNSASWKHGTPKLAISDPMTYDLILNPVLLQSETKRPAAAQALLMGVEGIRAEIDAATK